MVFRVVCFISLLSYVNNYTHGLYACVTNVINNSNFPKRYLVSIYSTLEKVNFNFPYKTKQTRVYHISLMLLSVAMTSSVKLFQAAQQYMRVTGIYPPQPGQSHSFNAKSICFLFCLIIIFALVASFFLFQAKTSVEYSISFYSSVTLLTAIALLVIHVCKASRSFKKLKSMEKFIEKSK